MDIEGAKLDRMQSDYKPTVEAWIAAIRLERQLASVNHSVADVDLWENAHSWQKQPAARRRQRTRHERPRCGLDSLALADTAPLSALADTAPEH